MRRNKGNTNGPRPVSIFLTRQFSFPQTDSHGKHGAPECVERSSRCSLLLMPAALLLLWLLPCHPCLPPDTAQTGLLVTCTVEGAQLETFHAPMTQTLRHVLARAQVDCPEMYGLTLVGDNLLTQRRVLFRGINGDLRGSSGSLLTLHDMCSAAPFEVYSIEIGCPFPPLELPAAVKEEVLCISDDDMAAGPRALPSPPPVFPPAAKKVKQAARHPLSPPSSTQVERQWPSCRGQSRLLAAAPKSSPPPARPSPPPSPVFTAQGRFVAGLSECQGWAPLGLAASLGLASSRSPSPQVNSSVCTCAQTLSLTLLSRTGGAQPLAPLACAGARAPSLARLHALLYQPRLARTRVASARLAAPCRFAARCRVTPGP